MGLKEKIKSEAVKPSIGIEGFSEEEEEWVRLPDVLAEIDNYKCIPLEDWQEIIELGKQIKKEVDLIFSPKEEEKESE